MRCSGCIPAKGRIVPALQEMSLEGMGGFIYSVCLPRPHKRWQKVTLSLKPTGRAHQDIAAPVALSYWDSPPRAGQTGENQQIGQKLLL